MLDMKNMQQRKMIEANTAAARLKEEEEKWFTNPEEELRKMFSGQLKEEEMSRCFKPKRLMKTI